MHKYGLLCLLVLYGCAPMAPRNAASDVARIPVPDTWLFAERNARSAQQQQWWRAYGSTELNALIARALNHNHDLRRAALNWQKVRLAHEQNQAERGTTLNAAFSGNISRPLEQGERSRHDVAGQFSAAYQLDLWQKLSLAEPNTLWQSQASGEDRLAAKLSLIGAIVQGYIDLAWIDEQIRLNEQTLHYQRDRITRIRERYALGDVAQIEVLRSEQALNQQQRLSATLAKDRQDQLLQLALLSGEPPSLLNLTPPPITKLTAPNLAATMPASLLRQRPDLRAAQYRLQQRLNDITIAERAFYPDINLSAGLNSGGVALSQILSNPIGSLSASVTLPFLHSKQLNLRKQESELDYQEALNDFEQRLYRALRDVNSALLNIQHNNAERELLSEEQQQTRQITQISKDRYELGAGSLQNVLDAEQDQRDAEKALLANHYAQLSASVALALALGGGL